MAKDTDTFLLRAPREDMDRWRQDARDQGLGFTAHIRHCLDRVTAYPSHGRHEHTTPDIANPHGFGKKSYEADPK